MSDLSHHYKVKFPWGRKTLYGIWHGKEAHFSDGKRQAAEGKVWIEEAITGVYYEVPEPDITDIEDKWGTYDRMTGELTDADEYDMYVNVAYLKAKAKSDALPNRAVVAGKMFQMPIADGSAYYVITRVNKTTVRVEWRGFCSDRWVDRMLGYGGSFRKQDIERLV